MALQGSIDSFALADVMRLLASSGKTGRLVLNGDRGAGNMWLVDGELVGGNTAAVGSPSGPGDPGEVLFDMMRFTEGSFIFEADAPCPEPRGGVPVEPIIRQAEDALDEWRSIIEVVPGLDAWMELSAEIAREITLDQRNWSVIVAIGGGALAASVAEDLDLGELPVLRVLRDLVSLGLLVVGEAPAEAAPVAQASGAGAPPAADAGDGAPAFAEVFNSGDAPASAAEAAGPEASDDDVLSTMMSEPAGDTSEGDDLDDLFGAFDPFGESATIPSDDDLFAPVEEPSAFTPAPTAEPAPEPASGTASADPADDLQRQMAMLSPQAAQAIANAAQEQGSEPDDRAEVIKFLGSV